MLKKINSYHMVERNFSTTPLSFSILSILQERLVQYLAFENLNNALVLTHTAIINKQPLINKQKGVNISPVELSNPAIPTKTK